MNTTSKRKTDHISINLDKDVNSSINNGLEKYAFIHQALPDVNLREIDTSTSFLDRNFKLPLLISSMTGGTPEGDLINEKLAVAAQEMGIGMGVGSQRGQIESGNGKSQQRIRKLAPNVPLYANLGAIQLNYGFTIREVMLAVDFLEADGLILHLNALQEALQPEGETNFRGLTKKIEKICSKITVPVIVKEVGWGISAGTAKKLVEIGAKAIDVAGAGGTSWSEVEKFRSENQSQYRIASRFRDWGIPTAEAVVSIHELLPDLPLIASGGILNGVEIAKAMALGASLAGIARPFLVAANESTKATCKLIQEIKTELSITMFAAGAKDMQSLRTLPVTKR